MSGTAGATVTERLPGRKLSWHFGAPHQNVSYVFFSVVTDDASRRCGRPGRGSGGDSKSCRVPCAWRLSLVALWRLRAAAVVLAASTTLVGGRRLWNFARRVAVAEAAA